MILYYIILILHAIGVLVWNYVSGFEQLVSILGVLVFRFYYIHCRTLLLFYLGSYLRLLYFRDLLLGGRLLVMGLQEIDQDVVHWLYPLNCFAPRQDLRVAFWYLFFFCFMLFMLRLKSYLMRDSIPSISWYTNCMLYLFGFTLKHGSKLPNLRHDILLIDSVLSFSVLAIWRWAWGFRFFIIILESFIARGWGLEGSEKLAGGFILGKEDIGGEIYGV